MVKIVDLSGFVYVSIKRIRKKLKSKDVKRLCYKRLVKLKNPNKKGWQNQFASLFVKTKF